MASIVRLKPLRRIPTDDRNLNLIQSHISDVIRSLDGSHNLVPSVQLKTGINLVSHGLGRNYVSWWPAQHDESVILKPLNDSVSNPDRSKYVAIQASAPTTVDIVVC